MFKSKKEIQNLINQADDNLETNRIIAKIENLKKNRNPFYLNSAEFDEILKWKLRSQYKRQEKIRKNNTEENINLITKMAFQLKHKDEDIETKLKINTLLLLDGVGIPVASAILTLCFPENYSVIDFRNWRQIFNSLNKKSSFTINEYNEYLKIIRQLSKNFGLTTQQIDLAIWQKDINEFG